MNTEINPIVTNPDSNTNEYTQEGITPDVIKTVQVQVPKIVIDSPAENQSNESKLHQLTPETSKIELTENEIVEIKPPSDIEKQVQETHEVWNKLLQKFVNNGSVNYAGFLKEVKTLDEYLGWLALNTPDDTNLSKSALVYWINTYNAFTIKLILNHYPLKSILDIDNGKPWDTKWIELKGKKYSLNQIENEIIRPRYKEPRIHFAINCAAKSCPPLSNSAFTTTNLESKLENLTKAFINNSRFNKVAEKNIQLSSIFDWYGVDFGNVITYLQKYSTTKIDNKAKISFLNYDWNLNE